MSEQEQNAIIANLTADIQALGAIVAELLAAYCKNHQNPRSEMDRIRKNVGEFLSDAQATSLPHSAQMNEWLEKRVNLIFELARRRPI